MICAKGQLVRIAPPARTLVISTDNGTARVLCLVYTDRPEGERGVQLDRALGGSRWWLEGDLEAAE